MRLMKRLSKTRADVKPAAYGLRHSLFKNHTRYKQTDVAVPVTLWSDGS